MTTSRITKRIQPTNMGYICYLNTIEVGTAHTYSKAEHACVTAYACLTIASAIRMQPVIGEDRRDATNDGQETGVAFFADTGTAAIELHIPIAADAAKSSAQ